MADLNQRGATKARSSKCIACGRKWKGDKTVCPDCLCIACGRAKMLCECNSNPRREDD